MCRVGLIENDMITITISHHLLPFMSVISFWSRFSFGQIASDLSCRKHTLKLWLSWQDWLSLNTSKALMFPSLWWTQNQTILQGVVMVQGCQRAQTFLYETFDWDKVYLWVGDVMIGLLWCMCGHKRRWDGWQMGQGWNQWWWLSGLGMELRCR